MRTEVADRALSAKTRSSEEWFRSLYVEHAAFLAAVATRKFGVPESEAEALVQDVFLSYLRRHEEIRDLKGWLLGAICNASRYYWRSMQRVESELALTPNDDNESEGDADWNVHVLADRPMERIDPASRNIVDSLSDQVAAHEVLDALSPRASEVLRLRFFEGLSIEELANRLGLSTKYAQRLVTQSLRRAERWYRAQERSAISRVQNDSVLHGILSEFLDAYRRVG